MIRCLLVLFFLSIPWLVSAETAPDWRINAAVGDASWVAVHEERPATGVNEVVRIRTHLYWVATQLERTDISALDEAQKERRTRAIGWLRDYAAKGVFPQRQSGDGYEGRRPRFIDHRNVHCAVGELIRVSGRSELARRINDDWEFAYVPDIESTDLAAWADEYGFTVDELAMIQPSYKPPPSAETVESEILMARDGITIHCGRTNQPDDVVRLKTRGNRSGEVHVDLVGPDTDFSRCFVERLEKSRLGGGAWDQQPKAFRNRLKIEIRPPSEIFDEWLQASAQGWRHNHCSPRPGVLPRSASARVRLDQKGVRVDVQTFPENAEVSQCLADGIIQQFSKIEGGQWDIELSAVGPIEPKMRSQQLANVVEYQASAAGRVCYDRAPQREMTVRVVAVPVATDFLIEVATEDRAFRDCVVEEMGESLRSNFSVSRKLPSGEFERYFRIDGFGEATATVELESPEEHRERVKREFERLERERQNIGW